MDQNLVDDMIGGFKDELYSLTAESNEIVLKSLYPVRPRPPRRPPPASPPNPAG